MLHNKLGPSPVELVRDEALVRSVLCDRPVEVYIAGAEPAGTGLLHHREGALTVHLEHPASSPPGEAVELRFEEGQHRWSLATRLVEIAADGAWVVEWPEMVRRRDRRRFVREYNPERYDIRTSAGEALALVDFSVNGAAFSLHSPHHVRVGDRLQLEVSYDSSGPAPVSFQVLEVTHDAHNQTWSMRGRFLEHAEPTGPLDDEVHAILDHLGRLFPTPSPAPPRGAYEEK